MIMEMQSGLDYLGAAGNMIEKYEVSDFTAPTFFEASLNSLLESLNLDQ
jgi:hypothetical protein